MYSSTLSLLNVYVWMDGRMKQRFDSDLSAAIENLCRGLLVDTGCCNDKPVRIGGSADISDFRILQICTAALVRTITVAKRSRFDNFTGNFLSHFITPTRIIIANSRVEIKGNLDGRNGRRISVFFRGIIFEMLRFYRTVIEFIMDNYGIYGIEYRT